MELFLLSENPGETGLTVPHRVFIVYNTVNWDKEEPIILRFKEEFIEIIDWELTGVTSQAVKDEITGEFNITSN